MVEPTAGANVFSSVTCGNQFFLIYECLLHVVRAGIGGDVMKAGAGSFPASRTSTDESDSTWRSHTAPAAAFRGSAAAPAWCTC